MPVMPKCANCKHARVIAQDLTKRICRGAPPTPLLVPVQGGVQMQFHWPAVDAEDEGCGLFTAKTLIDTPEGTA